MDITIYQTLLPHDDPDASLAFYRDALGFEVRNDVEYQGMHWITVGPADQPGTSIVLYPPAAASGVTDDERRTIAEMMAKGTYASINLATADPRSCGQPAPHPGAALSHPEEVLGNG
jgi:catechol 2,3-dioxygenase-like lactoylglutathione lyase family enzyme